MGAYDAKPSDSAYGTFDQGGNVWEWNEAVIDDLSHGARGASFDFPDSYLLASYRVHGTPSGNFFHYGFRVATVPEPTTLSLLALGGLALLRRRR